MMDGRFKKLHQARKCLYSAAPLKAVLESLFDTDTLGDVETRVVVPAINYTKGSLQAFKAPHHPDFKRDWKLSLVDIALATTKALISVRPIMFLICLRTLDPARCPKVSDCSSN